MNFVYLALARDHVSVCITLCMYVLSFADSMLVCALADSYVRPYDDPFLMASSREEIKRKLQVLKHEAMRVECGELCSSLGL